MSSGHQTDSVGSVAGCGPQGAGYVLGAAWTTVMAMPSPLLRRVRSTAVRLGMTAQNALEVARFGGLDTGAEPSPFDVVGRTPVYRLRRYFPSEAAGRPPLLLVPPLMLSAEVYDVDPHVSGVAALAELGVDPWVVDFGAPEREEGGLQRTLADHVLAVSDAIDRVRAATGTDVHLGGYSQGGMFCYQTAAFRRNDGIASLIAFGSPVDVHLLAPAGLPVAGLADVAATLADAVLSRTSVPPQLSRRVFQMLDPLKTARNRLNFLLQLHNREALLAREGSRRFLEADGWVAWPGPAVAEFATQFLAHNRMLSGGFTIGDRMVSLADIAVPTMVVVGTRDEIANPPAVRAIRRAVPSADIFELTVDAGHMGLVVGRGAREDTWPVVAQWLHWREGTAAQPRALEVLTEDHDDEAIPTPVEVAGELAVNAAQVVAETAVSAGRAVRGVFGEAVDQLPRLARLDRISGQTRVSLALLLDERARRHPDDTFFLFNGRGYSYAEAMRRIDAVTRGLLSLGVRQGEHVGVLMHTRPSAVALTAALSRLGAVPVMLRPDGDIALELRLGQCSRVIADPTHAKEAMEVWPGQVWVLGAGEANREVPEGALDMERIDPDAVDLPGWYEPNPGRARDLALVLFTARGSATRANRISNRRWAVSAFGTASAASLDTADTVYAISPLHHPATLMTAIGGAVASGARIAIAPRFTPDTFWEEVRRYGVTVVSYTWAMVGELLDAEPRPGERHHPIRLFVGSGMPPGLWEQVLDRFRPARVLEFYAPTEGDAVLANLSRDKVGAMGRPLPSTGAVAVAAYDVETASIRSTPEGFVQEAEVDEPGVLLVDVARGREGVRGRLLRGVFARGDAWLSTGDMFTRDADGDLWLLGAVRSVIRTAEGPVFPNPVEAALYANDAVNLCAVHALRLDGATHDVVAAAVTVRAGRELTDANLRGALALVDRRCWPMVIRVRGALPLSTHHRIQKSVLREEPIGPDEAGWMLDKASGRYVPLDVDALAAD